MRIDWKGWRFGDAKSAVFCGLSSGMSISQNSYMVSGGGIVAPNSRQR
jgi:hypothetical protein